MNGDNITVEFLIETDRLHKWIKQQVSDELNKVGLKLTTDQWLVLLFLHEKDPQTQVTIANQLKKDPASMTRIIDLIEKNGWVHRIKVEGDRRKFAIQLSVEGRRKAKMAHQILESLDTRVSQRITDETFSAIASIIKP